MLPTREIFQALSMTLELEIAIAVWYFPDQELHEKNIIYACYYPMELYGNYAKAQAK